ncbi:translation factor GTPase family protein [Streptomyces griseus]|uniref:translation factor GTPase family protein n=1 Tax=Streptomyces griseus TaxID=1911 RepID=UPI0033AE9D21
MHTLNLGILAHVDAGKTSLTERLLHTAGAIDAIGSVDDGSTRTDTLALERRRGITIKSAVVSFTLGATRVNLIDTPGHPDFIAEVERVLGVLDGAVLVVSSVEGVQAQTRVLLRTLRRLGIPTLLFANKTDRPGARYDSLLTSITERLSPHIVAMGSARGLGTRAATTTPFTGADPGFTGALTDLLTRHDDELLSAYVDDPAALTHVRLLGALAEQTARCLVHPVFFGSAATGAGIDALVEGVTKLLPPAAGDPRAPARGTVFKVDRTANGERTAYVRMAEGTVRAREVLRFRGPDGRESKGRVTAVGVFENGAEVPASAVRAGRIGRLKGLTGIRIGDSIGAERADTGHRHFAPPTLEAVVVPRRTEDRGALHVALGRLADQDPLIAVRRDDLRGEVSLSLYGEVQKEVVRATLAEEFGVDVDFLGTTTICRERPAGPGAAAEFIGTAPNPFLATVGLRADPAPHGSGVEFRRAVELGSMPPALMRAVEETARATLARGMRGWEVTDCVVTQTHSGYDSVSSTAGDFRGLTPLVLTDALRRAGTRVYEPMHRFRLEAPADLLGALLPVLARLRAEPGPPGTHGRLSTVEGEIPAAGVHELQRLLPGATRGEGVLESSFAGHRPVTGPAPERPRTGHDPLHREEYLLRTVRRVAGRTSPAT